MFIDQTQPASEAIGIAAAILILLLAFGSLLAMGLPIMTALFGIGIGLAIVTLLARVLDIPSFAPQVTAMIGIGVGIDYALFISTRYREALHDGADPEQAVVHAIDTSGRAVLFAGGTVVISLLGLFVIGVSFIRGLAIGASLAVLLQIPAEMVHYGVTKTAQLALSRGIAESVAGTGVTVNSVLPGPTRSEGVATSSPRSRQSTRPSGPRSRKSFCAPCGPHR